MSRPTLDQLEALIGQRVRHLDHDWQIIEVLEDEMALVLQSNDNQDRILSNAHGEAVRSQPDTLSLPVMNPEGDGINPELRQMQVLAPD